MIRLNPSSSQILHQIRYLNAGIRRTGPVAGVLDVEAMDATGLGDLAALVVMGDLQFRELSINSRDRPARLLGEVVSEELAVLSELGELPPPDSTGIVLTGDLFCEESLNRRGGLGDVRTVWEAFADSFAFVVGVAGNHDSFGDSTEQDPFTSTVGRGLLDFDVIERGGLTIGGVSGIMGDPKRPNRRFEDEYLQAVALLAREKLDLMVMHEAPEVPSMSLPGNGPLGELLNRVQPTLVACGHVHWDKPVAPLASGSTVLNVDARCVALINQK